MAEACEATGRRHIALDGKACRSAPRNTFSGCLHLVSALVTESRLILGQAAVADGSHEIATLPELLRVCFSRPTHGPPPPLELPFPAPEMTVLQLAAPLVEQNLGYARRLVADLADNQLAAQPVAGLAMNHAAFVVGHLAWVCDVGATLLGEAAVIDPGWKELFSSTATPLPDRAAYPTKEVLVIAFETAHSRLAGHAQAASPEVLQGPAPERFRTRFPTLAHILLHMLTNHEAVHLGQLSAWRRASGLPSV